MSDQDNNDSPELPTSEKIETVQAIYQLIYTKYGEGAAAAFEAEILDTGWEILKQYTIPAEDFYQMMGWPLPPS